jgi:hypothetical protein
MTDNKYVAFTIKTAIVVAVVFLGILITVSMLVDSVDFRALRTDIQRSLDEKSRIRMRGLLVSNPAVHYKLSEVYERDGDFEQAIAEIEFAIGLLELHSASKAVQERFHQRLKALKAE